MNKKFRFIVDAQLPPSLALMLIEAGHEAVALRNVGLREAEDESIWDYAQSHQMVIITKDEDFAERVQLSFSGPSVVWLRIGNCSNTALSDWLMPLLPDVVERLVLGDRLVEVS